MSKCKGINNDSIFYKVIIDDFTELKELNLFDTDLSIQSVDYLVNNITTKIEKLSLRSLYFVRDRHVKTLVKRCKNITELDLFDTAITEDAIGKPNF